MSRVSQRTWLLGLFLLVLLGGMCLFVWQYTVQARAWVSSPNSPHLFSKGNLGCGIVTDRSGVILLENTDSRQYSDNALTRKSTLHWVGDRQGSISAAAVSGYAADMTGFDLVNGLYDYAGVGGVETLTLSARVQNVALQAFDGRKGTAAVYNYRTGEILCAVTAPTYDPDNVPDLTGDAYDGVYLNRFLRGRYVPGSIFKLVTAAAALETVPDILERHFVCNARYSYGTEAVTCERAHGTLDLKGALASSCNCSFAQIAELVGRQNMEKYVEKLGVTKSVSFDHVTSAEGNYSTEDTGAASFAWSCIGQHTDLINPAGFLTYMGAIANGGKPVQPYLVAKVERGEETTYEAETVTGSAIMQPETAERLKDYMRNNVQQVYGDGNFPGLQVCAKSGTSQLGGGLTSNAMFAGFVADENYPLAFIVVIENAGYGSANCVPVLSRILAECKAVLDGR